MALTSESVRQLGVVVAASVVLLSGCTSAGDSEVPQAATESAPTPTVAVKPAVSINALMVALVDHAGHVVWDAEQPQHTPKTEADWEELEHHAIQLAASGPLMAFGGTGTMDATWVQSPDWQRYSQATTDAGVAILAAARSKNLDALVAANGRLVEACEACHKQFKPDLPTEGLVHSHRD